MKDLLGGKGANLADMTLVPLPVPPGFTITTDTCGDYNDAGQKLPAGLMDEVRANIAKVEKATGKKFGDPKNPLLVAARSGAKFSMPGMMDTVLNIGLNDAAVEGLAALSRQRALRLRQLSPPDQHVRRHRHGRRPPPLRARAVGRQEAPRASSSTPTSTTDGLKEVVERYKKVYKRARRRRLPARPVRAARGGDRGRLQELDGRPRDHATAS